MNAARKAVAWVVMAYGIASSAGVPAVAANAPGAAQTTPMQVEIRDFAFAPRTLTVSVGARVVWTNRDDEPHRIMSASGTFVPSRALDTSDSYAVTFSKPGTYAYYCSIHPMMVGTIIVK